MKKKLKEKTFSSELNIHKTTEKVFIFFLNFSPAPTIERSLEIDSKMNINIYLGVKQVHLCKFAHLAEDSRLSLWSQLKNILSFIKNMDNEVIKEDNFERAL